MTATDRVRHALRALEPDADTIDLTPLPLDELRDAFALLTVLRDRVVAAVAAHPPAAPDGDATSCHPLDALVALRRSPLHDLLAATVLYDVAAVPRDELVVLAPLLAQLHAAADRALRDPHDPDAEPPT